MATKLGMPLFALTPSAMRPGTISTASSRGERSSSDPTATLLGGQRSHRTVQRRSFTQRSCVPRATSSSPLRSGIGRSAPWMVSPCRVALYLAMPCDTAAPSMHRCQSRADSAASFLDPRPSHIAQRQSPSEVPPNAG
jgi:hypothetical protein